MLALFLRALILRESLYAQIETYYWFSTSLTTFYDYFLLDKSDGVIF
mgnify:CR=1 FL=1